MGGALPSGWVYGGPSTPLPDAAYGEQGADTDGGALSADAFADALWNDARNADGLAAHGLRTLQFDAAQAVDDLCGIRDANTLLMQRIAELETRIAARDKTIDALMTRIVGMDATMAGLRTEAQRLSELAQDLQAQLSARHGAQGEPATGPASTPTETLRANPFAHGWATNWRMR